MKNSLCLNFNFVLKSRFISLSLALKIGSFHSWKNRNLYDKFSNVEIFFSQYKNCIKVDVTLKSPYSLYRRVLSAVVSGRAPSCLCQAEVDFLIQRSPQGGTLKSRSFFLLLI